MDINVQEPLRNTKKRMKRARKQARRRAHDARRRAIDTAIDTVESVRAGDLHEPAQAVGAVAKRTAKRAAKRTVKRGAKKATAAAGRGARRKSNRAARRLARVGAGAVIAGIALAVIVVVVKRMRTASEPDVAIPNTFDAAEDPLVDEAMAREPGTQSGSNGDGAAARTPQASAPTSTD